MTVYSQRTWYVQTTGQWHGTVVAATAEDAIESVWELLDARVGGRGDTRIRSVDEKPLIFIKGGSI